MPVTEWKFDATTFFFCPCCESEVFEYEGENLEERLKAEGWKAARIEWTGDGVDWSPVEGGGTMLICPKCAEKSRVVVTLGISLYGLGRAQA